MKAKIIREIISRKPILALGFLIGILAFIGLFVFAGYKIALCIFFAMWANNIGRD